MAREGDERSYLMGEPVQEAMETTIFDGLEWPELRGKLFRFCQREYGRCASKVYIDSGPEKHQIGWCFERLRPYEDAPERTYTHAVWVTLLTPVQCDRGQRHLEPVYFDREGMSANGKTDVH